MGVGEGHNKYLVYKNDNFNAPTRFDACRGLLHIQNMLSNHGSWYVEALIRCFNLTATKRQ